MSNFIELHATIKTMRNLSWGLLRKKRFASNAADLVLLIGVAICELEARPMTAFKLSEFIGMPRATVVRKLESMRRAGLVRRDGHGRYTLTSDARARMRKANGKA